MSDIPCTVGPYPGYKHGLVIADDTFHGLLDVEVDDGWVLVTTILIHLQVC